MGCNQRCASIGSGCPSYIPHGEREIGVNSWNWISSPRGEGVDQHQSNPTTSIHKPPPSPSERGDSYERTCFFQKNKNSKTQMGSCSYGYNAPLGPPSPLPIPIPVSMQMNKAGNRSRSHGRRRSKTPLGHACLRSHIHSVERGSKKKGGV